MNLGTGTILPMFHIFQQVLVIVFKTTFLHYITLRSLSLSHVPIPSLPTLYYSYWTPCHIWQTILFSQSSISPCLPSQGDGPFPQAMALLDCPDGPQMTIPWDKAYFTKKGALGTGKRMVDSSSLPLNEFLSKKNSDIDQCFFSWEKTEKAMMPWDSRVEKKTQ